MLRQNILVISILIRSLCPIWDKDQIGRDLCSTTYPATPSLTPSPSGKGEGWRRERTGSSQRQSSLPKGTSASSPKGLAFGPSAFGFAACRHRMYRRLVSPSRGNKKAILPQNAAACRGRLRRRPISSTRGKEKGCFAGIPLPQNRCPHEEAPETAVGHTAEDNGQILSRCPHDTPADCPQTGGTVDNESTAEAGRTRAEWWSRGHISPEPFFRRRAVWARWCEGKAVRHIRKKTDIHLGLDVC